MKNAATYCFLLGLLLGLTGCVDDSGQQSDSRIKVVATTTMIADLARNIVGDKAQVVSIMKPGEDPHVYDVRPRDAQAIADADVVLYNGHHLEATLLDIIANNTEGTITAALAESPEIKTLVAPGGEGAPDPHCWFNVKYFMIYVLGARDALIAADPENATTYRDNAAAHLAELAELDAYVAVQLETIPRQQRVMITSHDAFQYFGDAYGIDVFAVIGISTEQAPKPQDLARIAQMVRDNNVKALFLETSVALTLNQIVKKVAADTGATVGGTLYSDSLGDSESGADTYIKMVRHNTDTLVEALK